MTDPKTYRKKPVEIQAMQVEDNLQSHADICTWAESCTPEGKVIPVVMSAFGSGLLIHTLEGTMHAGIGDYIIRGVEGEMYPCQADIFHQTYEEVTND